MRPSQRRARRNSLIAACMGLPGLGVPVAANAQAPGARPSGGTVVAGQAGISQTGSLTQVRQGSDRAVIEWQRFDVGAGHQVDIRQPAPSSWSLQRVTGGDPSAIAGRVTSNGGVALVNPAGVLFHQGAQVDVASLIATTADITNQNFMQGRMVFDGAPRPGARVENRGQITVAEQGLAALVGPQVANSGTIRARLGRVALAGGEAFALDLAGDGLLAIDVTRQVSTAPSGATALVTQAGTIEAEGGSVLLTARAASGVLENLVRAGGNTTARQVALRAQGGGVRIDGAIATPGGSMEATASGSREATASGVVRLAGSGRISAPGGRVTLGAGAESRIGAPSRLATRTVVEPGAAVSASGGSIIVHAAESTEMHGRLAAEGGAIEVSSHGALALDGVMEAGPGGRILVDPVRLRVVDSLSGASEPAEITAAAIGATTGALTLQAERNIRVEAAISKPSGPLTLETTNPTAAAGEGIQFQRGVTVTGDLVLRSAGDITQVGNAAPLHLGTLAAYAGGEVRLTATNNQIRAIAGGAAASGFAVNSRLAMSVDGALSAAGIAFDTPQTLTLFAPITTPGRLDLFALRGVTQQASGAAIQAGELRLDSALGTVRLEGAGNRIATLGDSFVPRGLSLANEAGLQVVGGINAGALSLTLADGDLTQSATSRLIAESLHLVVPNGAVVLDAPQNGIAEIYGQVGDRLLLVTPNALSIAAPLSAPEIALQTGAAITQDQGARLTALTLSLDAAGAVTLENTQNAVSSLGAIRSDGAFSLATSGALVLRDSVVAPEITLRAGGALTAPAGSALVTDHLALTGSSVLVEGAGHSFGVLGAGGSSSDFSLTVGSALRLDGALSVAGALALDAAALAFEAPVTAGATSLLAQSGDITQTAAAPISATSLLVRAPLGSVWLAEAGNDTARLGGVAAEDFAWRGLGGAVADPNAGLAAARIALQFGGGFSQATNAAAGISATQLSVQAGGAIDLRAAGNAIDGLGTMQATGGLALATGAALNLTGPVSGASVALSAPLGISQSPGGRVDTNLLAASASGGDVQLGQALNVVARLGASDAAGDFSLTSNTALMVEGAVSAGGTLALQVAGDLGQSDSGAGLSAAVLAVRSLFGNVALTGTGNGVLALAASGASGAFGLAQEGPAPLSLTGPIAAPTLFLRTESGLDDRAGGALRGDSLRLDTAGVVRLDAAGMHTIDSIAGRAGSLYLALDGALQVTEALQATGTLSLSASTLGLLAPVAAGSADLLATGGSITQTLQGAGLSASQLTARAEAGSVLLDGQGNRVASLGSSAASGDFALAQIGNTALQITGPVAAQNIFLSAETGVQGGPSAVLSAGLLRLASPGSIQLDARQHALDRIGGQVGALSLASAGSLTISELLTVTGALNLSATALQLEAPVSAGAALLVARSGDIVQSATAAGLSIGSAGLRLSAAGTVALEGADNAVLRLSGATAGGRIGLLTGGLLTGGLLTGGALTVSGTQAGSDIVLRAGGSLRLDGAMFSADRAVLLVAPGGFTAGTTSQLAARDPAALPVLILDSRQGGLSDVPAGLVADVPGLEAARQSTQIGDFGGVRIQAGGPTVFALNAGDSPVFFLLDGAPAVGTVEAGRLGLLGQGGSAFINGVLGGVGGEAAAQLVTLPAGAGTAATYLFNNCVIAASTCSGVPEAQPIDPGTPTDPGKPTIPGTPTDPGTPTEPGTPPDPGTPAEPVAPIVPGIPAEPVSPIYPGTPDKPGIPTLPNPKTLPASLSVAPWLADWDLRLGAAGPLLPRREEDEDH